MSPGRWIRSLAALVGAAALVAAAAGPVHAAYQATAYSNGTAFSFNCIGINDTYPSRLLASALAGYRNLGYATTGVTGAELADKLLNEGGVSALAGTAFGAVGKYHLRFSYANSRENITEALRRTREVVEPLVLRAGPRR